jgi:DNA helicase-2/ATP-dependent DNA helicase PcrA
MDFIPDDDNKKLEVYYIGKIHIPIDHVYCWDTGIAEMYRDLNSNQYEYEVKDHKGQKEKRVMKGLVTLRRQLTVQNSLLVNYQDIYHRPTIYSSPQMSKRKVTPLTTALSKSKTDQMKDIVETLQPDQYDKIKAPIEQVIIVQGAAGSGKSEIGLHRLAYLLSPVRDFRLQPEDVIMFGPSQVFLSYISNVLPGLNVPQVRQRTVSEWLISSLSHPIGKLAKDQLQDRILTGSTKNLDSYVLAESLKGSLKMAFILENHVQNLKAQHYKNVSDIIASGKILVKKELIKKSIRDSQKTHINELRQEIFDFIMGEVRKIARRQTIIVNEKQIDLEISRFWPRIDFLKEYSALISNTDTLSKAAKNKLSHSEIETLIDYGTKLGKIKDTDLPALGYLDYLVNDKLKKLERKRIQASFSHIVIDEAQDISALTLKLIQKYSRNNSFTILGDIAQHVLPYRGIFEWKEIRSLFSQKNTRMLKAQLGYRSTYEITVFARDLIKLADPMAPKPQAYRRHGEKVRFIRAKSKKESIQAISEDIISLQQAPEINSIAILCKTKSIAEKVFREIIGIGIKDVSLLDKTNSMKSRLVVGSILMSKGLEFDAVLIVNANNKQYHFKTIDNKLLYLAVTRAAHKLHIHWYGKITDILALPGFYDRDRNTKKKVKGRKGKK